jgi:hypothetical protein
MRRLGQVISSSAVKYTSRALRTKLRPLHRNRFFAVCWLIVLAPRRRSPSSASSIASRMACTSKPW